MLKSKKAGVQERRELVHVNPLDPCSRHGRTAVLVYRGADFPICDRLPKRRLGSRSDFPHCARKANHRKSERFGSNPYSGANFEPTSLASLRVLTWARKSGLRLLIRWFGVRIPGGLPGNTWYQRSRARFRTPVRNPLLRINGALPGVRQGCNNPSPTRGQGAEFRHEATALSGCCRFWLNSRMNTLASDHRRYRFPPEIYRYRVSLYIRLSVSYRDVEELMAARGVLVTDETIRAWRERFSSSYAKRIRARRRKLGHTCHLDEMFISTGCACSIFGVRRIMNQLTRQPERRMRVLSQLSMSNDFDRFLA